MTILWIGAEDIDFSNLVGIGGWNGTPQRAGYDRVRLMFNDYNTADPNKCRATGNLWASSSADFWFSAQVRMTQFQGNAQWIVFLDAAGTRRLMIMGDVTNTSTKICKRNAAGTITTLASLAWQPTLNVVHKIDVHVVYGASGSVTVYCDGAQVGTYSGDVTTDSATALQMAEVCGVDYNINMSWSELIVASTDTRSMNVVTLTNSTAGAAQQWTGTASNVNQSGTVNDTQFIYSDTAGQIQEYQPIALPSGSFVVEAVVMSARAMRGASGPQNLQYVTRVGSTDYTPIAAFSPATGFTNYQGVITQNPATSSAWSKADLAAANFQYGLKSVA
jgi:hypothetical protein